ncbi:MAG: TetR/AcrR family transcriptional regulator [Pseudomonadota bacterium]|uniref:TetR/AcrR family transcriptional regulator n=1 Tax=Erythrobacteraceae TaxID=335929 RepID=UPI000C9F9229|nr:MULTISPECIES: TetR/AcrR family transcriptional regulator [Erythrobacteraceae]MBY8333693.1 TetR/AcrR family transcriptional regulator [Qipengyuania pacifica]MEC7953234.1 TetR/AcrR family transcriptional regulator [Pseudomonadota bacterium]MEE2793458.1 TetR/AcrR family transcriptional regulator [Pseudomonadota bacterium]PNQ75750.1 TetR family transcriptional regulator [Erythrobacter sp. SAORIC-644]|tara:strand:- start:330 stop:929 length:600 start_codon:yes stop_codon:yes gene_type:complete
MEKVASRGRPREFDTELALGAALRVFWAKGYEGASLSDLTDEMGITRPSLYAAFGNKEALFRQALDLYERDKLTYIGDAIEAPTARGVAERLLMGSVDAATTGDCKGCMGVIASVACQSVEPSIRDDVNARAESSRRAIIARMQQAIDAGEFRVATEAEAITRYLLAIMQGISVQAQSGASREELLQVADSALLSWPSA